MKHLLLLSYFSPPHGGVGGLRSVETVRVLDTLGWRTTVIAGPEEGYWLSDPGLEERLPDRVRLVRTRAITGPGLIRSAGRLLRRPGGPLSASQRSERTIKSLRRLADWCSVPDVYCGWIPFATRAALEYAQDADCIMSTSPPESAHLAAWRVARKTGLPWVADFRDPWVRGIYRHYPTPIQRRIQERLERLVVEKADLIVATTERAVKDFRLRYSHLPGEKFQNIPNGFDPAEFEVPQRESPPPEGPLRIIHAGGLTLDRDLTPVLEALARLNSGMEKGSTQAACTLELVGMCDKRFRQRAEELGLGGETVTFTGFVPRSEVLKKLAASHMGLVLESFSPGAELVVPGKLYDYLGSGLPVLAVAPPGAVEDIVLGTGCGFAVTEPGKEKIVAVLRTALERFNMGAGLLEHPPGTEKIALYERGRLVWRLEKMLIEVGGC